MALDPNEVRVGGTGHLYVADVGTAFPADINAAIDEDDWSEVGYIDEEGARFSFGREVNEVMAWQAFDPLRLIVTTVPKLVSANLVQWGQTGLLLALGGGTITGSTGNWHYEPPAESFVDERALLVELSDGDLTYRFGYHRAYNQATLEFAAVRTEEMRLPVEMKILAPPAGTDRPFFIDTNDDAIGPAAS